jgi:hypothetical protein
MEKNKGDKEDKEDKYFMMYNSDQIDKDKKALHIWKWIALGALVLYVGIIVLRIITE